MEFMAIEMLLDLSYLSNFFTRTGGGSIHISSCFLSIVTLVAHLVLAYDTNTRTRILFPRTYTGTVFSTSKRLTRIQENKSFFLGSLQIHENGYCKGLLIQLNIKSGFRSASRYYCQESFTDDEEKYFNDEIYCAVYLSSISLI